MQSKALELNERQRLFFKARRRFIAYGGARGGGKTWAVREKAMVLACRYPGINILVVRRTYPELLQNHILPLQLELSGLARWNDNQKRFIFPDGSNIWFGYCAAERDVGRYQGQEYDIIFIDEATQLTEFQFQTFKGCLRGANDFPKRMYLTCNPGGVGHAWVKRLFVDRRYQGDERADDYEFIQAKVTDNPVLMEKDPEYIHMLESLPYELREAWLNGSWDVFAGQYFSEWDRDVHVVAPFEPPAWWRRYVTIDYGLDMLAAYLIAVDEHDMAYVVREVYQGRDLGEGAEGLIVSEAAKRILDMVGEDPAKTGGPMRIEKAPDPSAYYNYATDTMNGTDVGSVTTSTRSAPLMEEMTGQPMPGEPSRMARSWGWICSPSLIMKARSMTLRSSRTLPGQLYWRRRASAPGVRDFLCS